MRVHPGMLTPRKRNWQVGAACSALLVVLVVASLGRPRSVAVIQPVVQSAAIEKLSEVLVAQELIQAGQPLDSAAIRVEQRPSHTLPGDSIANFDVLKSKVAAGPIPPGNPISMAFLADPVTVIAEPDMRFAPTVEDPIDTYMREIERDTVALPIVFSAAAPPRGSRVAVTLSRTRGESTMVIEDCWVSKSQGREAVLRLSPPQALLMQSAKEFGQFGFIELSPDGASPFVGKGISSVDDLRAQLDGKPRSVAAPEKTTRSPRMKGYAWVTGEGIRFGLDENGDIRVLSQQEESMVPR